MQTFTVVPLRRLNIHKFSARKLRKHVAFEILRKYVVLPVAELVAFTLARWPSGTCFHVTYITLLTAALTISSSAISHRRKMASSFIGGLR